jgi:phage tail-like protein
MPASPFVSERSSSTSEDPLIGFNFQLEVSGVLTGFFTECSGVGSEHEIIEHKVVNEKGQEIVRKIPGRLKWNDVTLKRGVTSDLELWNWRDLMVQGKVADARKNATITMFNRQYEPVAQWHFTNAWPSKVSGPSFKSDDNSIGVEEVTIVHEGIYRET